MKRKQIWIMIIGLMFILLTGCGQYGGNVFEAEQGANIQGDQARYGQVSSQDTTIPSEEYPHTKAVQVQHAKYEFIITDGNEQHQGRGTARLSREDIERMLPNEIARLLPEGEQLTQEDIARLLPEGAQITPEEIQRRLQEGTHRGGAPQQPGQQQPEEAQQQPQEPTEQPQEEPATPAQPEQTEGISEIEQQVINLTNAERRRNGLSDLQADTSLSNVARAKSNDMQQNNYFSHTSPKYGSPFDMIRDFGVDYNAAAENIAQGQQTAEQVVQAWMNSEGHRANILNGNFTHIGVGHNGNGNYWTQMFISR
ncbi:CAP domain-containing protein [Alkalihalobacterium alkalinitrilicum]|uniref:CAP domain-containing protein n=1 Tax=Alkalihalobacterium alkalinitrilicum TaxID=427920 RepID=UPI001EE3D02B|nr:CAP domain-containing protein [Alkalihalobacterium alkalinitrilicum]